MLRTNDLIILFPTVTSNVMSVSYPHLSYMRSRHASRAWVITTSDFTPDGRDEARITNVIIMYGQEVLQCLELYYPGRFCL